jgi:hypothetical protein
MDLLVTLLIGIAWPAAAVGIAFMFKAELRTLIPRMSHLRYKDIEAKFEIALSEAEAKVVVVEQSSGSRASHPEIASKLELLRRVAEVSPRAAIMEAWVLVEDAAGRSGYAQGAVIARANPHLFVEELVRVGQLPSGSSSLLDQMRGLRNQAAHLPDFSLNQDEADRYLRLAARISELFLSAESSSDSGEMPRIEDHYGSDDRLSSPISTGP